MSQFPGMEPNLSRVEVVLGRRSLPQHLAGPPGSEMMFEYLVKFVNTSYLRVLWLSYQALVEKDPSCVLFECLALCQFRTLHGLRLAPASLRGVGALAPAHEWHLT